MTEPLSTTLGALLRSFRDERGERQRIVAAAVDMDASLLGHIERGNRLPTEAQLERLAGHYGKDAKTLLALRLAAEFRMKAADDEVLRQASQWLVAEPSASFIVSNSGKNVLKASR